MLSSAAKLPRQPRLLSHLQRLRQQGPISRTGRAFGTSIAPSAGGPPAVAPSGGWLRQHLNRYAVGRILDAERWPTWLRWVFRVGRAGRIAVIGVSLFSIGKLLGAADVMEDPEAADLKILKECVLANMEPSVSPSPDDLFGGESRALYRVIGEREKLDATFMYDAHRSHSSATVRRPAVALMAAMLDEQLVRDACDAKVHVDHINASRPDRQVGAAMSEQMARTQRVGRRVLVAARQWVDDQLDELELIAQKKCADKQEAGQTSELRALLEQNAPWKGAVQGLKPLDMLTGNAHSRRMTVAELLHARVLLDQTWQFVCYFGNANPNAFYALQQPRKIFMDLNMSAMCQSDDELAMVMGHEIAHGLYEHGRHSMDEELGWATVKLATVALLDPTGILAVLFEGLSKPMDIYIRSYGQEAEYEADALGLTLATRACYTPEDAVHMVQRLFLLETCDDPIGSDLQTTIAKMKSVGRRADRIMSTHPRTTNRMMELDALLEDHADQVEHLQGACAVQAAELSAFQRLFGGFFGGPEVASDHADAAKIKVRHEPVERVVVNVDQNGTAWVVH